MKQQFTVSLTYTRHMKFEVSAKDAAEAHQQVESSFLYDGLTPDDEGYPDLELVGLKVGDREIEVNTDLDVYGPKDARGLSRWRFTAYENDDSFHRHKLSQGYDLKAVVEEAFEQPKPQVVTASST